MSALPVPQSVVQMQLAANGEAGRAWLSELPRLVDELCKLWSITRLGPPFEGGCVAYVAPAFRACEGPAVLKVSLPDRETEHEADALALWNGNGAVRLLASDPGRGAMLLERLDPGTTLAAHPDREEAIAIACSLLRRLQVPAPARHPFHSVSALAAEYAATFPARYLNAGRPFDDRLLQSTLHLCRQFSLDTSASTLANADFHLGNVVAAQREPWLAIDPKPLVGDPAFDAAHLIRSLLSDPIHPPEFDCLLSAVACGLNLPPQRIAQWMLVRSVENALWAISTGDTDVHWDVACAQAAAESCC